MKELLLNYVNYNVWANSRLCGLLKDLTDEQWNAELKSSFKSIRLTLLHIWDAQIIWYLRLNGESVTAWPSEGFNGTNNEIVEQFLEQSESFIPLVQNMPEEELAKICEYKDMRGNPRSSKVCDIIQHCMNHSTFHRGQLVTMLRELGTEKLVPTDYIYYVWENQI